MTTNAPFKKIPLKMPSIAPSPKPPTMNDGKKRLTKYQFKVCEAVHLGLDYYYMGKNDRRKITDEDKTLASRVFPTLPSDWWKTKHSWDAVKY